MAKASVLVPLLQTVVSAGASYYSDKEGRKAAAKQEKSQRADIATAKADQTQLDTERKSALQGEADAAAEESAASDRAKRKTAKHRAVTNVGENEGLTGYAGAAGKKKLLGG